jgi:hypothetical protein
MDEDDDLFEVDDGYDDVDDGIPEAEDEDDLEDVGGEDFYEEDGEDDLNWQSEDYDD